MLLSWDTQSAEFTFVATAAERLSSQVTHFLNGTSLRVWDSADNHPLTMNRASLRVGKSTVCGDELSLDQDGSGVVDDVTDVGVWEREGVPGAFAVPPHLLEVRAAWCLSPRRLYSPV